MKISAAPCPGIRNPNVAYSHCTFVTFLFWTFCWGSSTRRYAQDVELHDHRPRFPYQYWLRLIPQPWVSDLALPEVESEFEGTLGSDLGCGSGLPTQTSVTSPSTTVSSLFSGSPSPAKSAKCLVHHSRIASVSPDDNDAMASVPCASSSLVAGLTCVRLHLCRQFRVWTHTVSFRPGFGSSRNTHNPGPHHPWAPFFRLCMTTVSPVTSAD